MEVVKLSENATVPTRAYHTSVAYDLYTCEEIILPYKQPVTINIQIAISLPPGTFGMVIARNSFARRNIHTHPTLIESEYRGPVQVVLVNFNASYKKIKPFSKVARLALFPVITLPIQVKSSFSADSHGFAGQPSSYFDLFTDLDVSSLSENVPTKNFVEKA